MATDDLLVRGAAESRKRAAELRRLAAEHHDDRLVTPAATADAEADLLDAIAAWRVAEIANAVDTATAVDNAAHALARLLVKED